MADLRGRTPQPEQPVELSVLSPLRTAAGTGVSAQLTITNRAPEPRVMLVTVVGSDADWLPRPSQSRPVPSGETVVADVVIAPAPGTIPARYPLAMVVETLDPVTGKPTAPAQVVDIELIVDAPGQIDLQVSPVDASGVFGQKLSITVRNSGIDVAPVSLEAQTTESLKIFVPRGEWLLPPGETARLSGRIRQRRARWIGGANRYSYTLTARSAGAPRSIEGSYTARAVFGSLFYKIAAIAIVVSFWVTMCIIYIPQIANLVRDKEAGSAFKTPGTNSSAPGATGNGSNGNGNGSNGNGNGSNGNGNGSNGNGSGNGTGNGSNGNGNGSNGNGGSGGAGAGAAALNVVQVNGTVGGTDPSGVRVSAVRTGLVAEKSVGATPNPASPDAEFSPDAMISGSELAEARSPRGLFANPTPETTAAEGTWSFRLQKPGYYLLTFSKPGFETQRYVIDSATAVSTQPIKVVLLPGSGLLQGTVLGPHGAVGNATVTITDGTSTITTSSNSKGQVGHWSVDGLSTPSTYLVTVTAPNLGAASELVKLPAGDRGEVVNVTMQSGVTMLAGTVKGRDAHNNLLGVGGAQITVTDGKITRSASTITDARDGSAPVGFFRIPGLPPGTYVETIDAPGYLVQTRRIVVKLGESQLTVNSQLSLSSALISGTIKGDVLDANGQAVKGGATEAEPDAGVTLTSPTNTYKLTTLSTPGSVGTFTFQGVVPGTYVLTAVFPNMDPASETIQVNAGDVKSLGTLTLHASKAVNDATIQGFVGDAGDPSNTISCPGLDPAKGDPACLVHFLLRDTNGKTVQTSPAEETPTIGALPYTLNAALPGGFAPGLYKLTVSAPTYLTATINVQVPQHGIAHAPPLNLTRSNSIAGLVTSVDGANLGPDSTGPSCVVAEPIIGATLPSAPTDCNVHGTDTCSSVGVASTKLGVIDYPTGAYKITGMCNATYLVYVFIANPDFYSADLLANPQSIAVAGGTTVPYSIQVSHKGSIQISLTKPINGSLVVASGITMTASCKQTNVTPNVTLPDITKTSDVAGHIIIGALDEGSYDCHLTSTDGFSGDVSALVQRNVVAQVRLTLTQPVGAVRFNVTTAFPSAQPVGGATVVKATGVTGYTDAGVAITGAVGPFTLPAGQSCFFVVPPNADLSTLGTCAAVPDPAGAAGATLPVPPNNACPTTTAVAIACNVLTLNFVTPSLDLVVSGSGYQTRTLTVPSLTTATPTEIALTPGPVNLALSLAAPGVNLAGAASDPAAATFRLTAQSSLAGAVSISTGATCAAVSQCRQLTWADTAASAAVATGGSSGNAMPGDYTLAIALENYATATLQIHCAVGGACTIDTTVPANCQNASCSGSTITLKQLHKLTVVTQNCTPLLTACPVNNAVVNITPKNGDPVQTAQDTKDTNTAVFNQLQQETYTLGVHAAGYSFSGFTVSCTGSATVTGSDITLGDSDSTCTVTLTKLGEIDGTVLGIRELIDANNPPSRSILPTAPQTFPTADASYPGDVLPNVAVGALFCDQDNACAGKNCASDTPAFTATSDANGRFTITGTTDNAGLAQGYWLVCLTLSGWQTYNPIDIVQVGAGQTATTPVYMFTAPVAVQLIVKDSAGNAVTDASVTITDGTVPPGNIPPPKHYGPTQYTDSKNGGCGCYPYAAVAPTLYNVSVSGSSKVSPFTTTISPGIGTSPQTITVSGNRAAATVSGSISAVQDDATAASGAAGVTVSLESNNIPINSTAGPGNPETVTTQADGTYTFLNVPVLASGTYTLAIDLSTSNAVKSGYSVPPKANLSVSVPITAGGGLVPVTGIQLVRAQHDVTITLTTPSSDKDINNQVNAQLASRDSTEPRVTTTLPLIGQNGNWTTTMRSMPFGHYTLTLNLPANHLANPTGMTCQPITATALAVRNCTVDVDLSPDNSDPVTTATTFSLLAESQVTFGVAIGTFPSYDTRTQPTDTSLTIHQTSATGTLMYQNDTFPVGGQTTALWLPDPTGASYVFTATGDNSGGSDWSGSLTASEPSKNKDAWPTATVQLNENTGSVTFVVEDNAGNPAAGTVTVVAPDPGITGPAGSAGTALSFPVTATGTITVPGFAFASGYTATAAPSGGTGSNKVTFNVTTTGTTTADTMKFP